MFVKQTTELSTNPTALLSQINCPTLPFFAAASGRKATKNSNKVILKLLFFVLNNIYLKFHYIVFFIKLYMDSWKSFGIQTFL
ncbi:MAG: hypothetical protein ACFFDF_12165 [Candidatus Odinarchaeota archaeon]